MFKRLLILVLLLLPVASALDSEYNIIVEDNGNALVIINLEGSGLVNIPLQKDVDDVKVKGALYKINDQSIDVSIGSTQEAVELYKTAYLTTKLNDQWKFKLDLINNTMTTVALPNYVIVSETKPNAFIEELNYTKIVFQDTNSIEISYKFPDDIIIEPDEHRNYLLWIINLGFVIIVALGASGYILRNKKSNKKNVIKTLSHNERKVINTLLENKGAIKRNDLERKTKLAKSSLANTLNMLERKKIIEIDKTYTTHFVKFTRWFNGL